MSDLVKLSLEELRALQGIINSSIDRIADACILHNKSLPASDLPSRTESEATLQLPDVQQASELIVAAASQLITIVRIPAWTLVTQSLQLHTPACLRAVCELHVPEILRESGPEGLHVTDIAAPTKTSPGKLAQILRLLATQHIFREVAPDTFANNRLSSCLDTGKPMKDILADPTAKFDNTVGVAAIICHTADEVFKSAAYLSEAMTDSAFCNSSDPSSSPAAKAFNTTLPMFEWFDLPENAHRLRRFGAAMPGSNSFTTPGALVRGFDWQALPKDSVIVDVGGGVGSQSLILAKTFDHLKFIVEDRASVVEVSGATFWNEQMPQAILSGRVTLKAHNFFEPQPVQGPAVFILRAILHDWPDEYCVKILRYLRNAAGPNTQLVVMDNIVTYACGDPAEVEHIPGAVDLRPPFPLLANKGAANLFAYQADLQMLTVLNAVERTTPQFVTLFEQGGWKLVRVHKADGGLVIQGAKIIGVPA